MASTSIQKAARFPRPQTLQFIPANAVLPNGINTWPLDQGFFQQHIRTYFQSKVIYNQKLNQSDTVTIYFDSLAPNVTLDLYTDQGVLVKNLYTASVAGAVYPGNVDAAFGQQYNTFYFNFLLSSLDINDGFYTILITTNYADDPNPVTNTQFVCEIFQLRTTCFEKTVLFEFENSSNDFVNDIYFQDFNVTVIEGDHTVTNSFHTLIDYPIYFRVEADIDIDPAFSDTQFKDMFETVEVLQSIPYKIGLLSIGINGGVPTWVLDKVNRILGYDTIMIDDVQWYKDENAAWSFKKADNYAMKVGVINLRSNPQISDWEYSNVNDEDTTSIHDAEFDDEHD